MKLTGAEIIIKVLLEQGVDTVFGYPGGQVIPLYDALYDAPIRNILTVHEQGAVHAADGYARASGKTGVCIATSGPGATNLVTGLATAYLDSVPLVAITGQVATTNLGRDSFQEIDIVGVTLPITKHNVLVRSVEKIAPALRRAFAVAGEGRPGPVLVDIPSDLQLAKAVWAEAELPDKDVGRAEIDEKSLELAAQALQKAERPLLLVGGGALLAGAENEARALAAKLDMPVVSTLMGLGVFPGGDERFLGLTGMHGQMAANLAVANADVLLVAGSRFSDRVTGNRGCYAGSKTIIQLDIDQSELDKNITAALPVEGDVKEALARLLVLTKAKKHSKWRRQIQLWQQSQQHLLLTGGELTAPWIMQCLNETLADMETVYVTDVGQNQMWAAQYLRVTKPRQHLTSGGCGTMGFGLPAALGAALAKPEAQVVHICGDGGFKMTGMELYTACRENIPLISIVLNNSCLGMVRQWQQLFYQSRYSATLLTEFDFTAFAESCGARGVRAATREEFQGALRAALAAGKPCVIEAVIARENLVEPMVAPGAAVDDFVKIL